MNQEFNPEWLLKIKKTGKIPDKIPFEKVLQRALFYPACYDDFRYIRYFTESLQNIEKNFKHDFRYSHRNLLNFISIDSNEIYKEGFSLNMYSALNNYYCFSIKETVRSILEDIFYVDTYIFTDYRGNVKEIDYSFVRNLPIYQVLLEYLSSKYKLICEKHIKTYKIDMENSSDTAIFIEQAENIEELIYCYKNDKKRYNEIFAKFKREKLKDNKIHWIFNEEEPFVHWSVWEDISSGKLFNVIYFVEEAHVNFLRTFIKYNCCPKILVLHRYSFGAWTSLSDKEKNFLKMMNFAGLPKYLIFEKCYVDYPLLNEYEYRNSKIFYGNYLKFLDCFYNDYFLIKRNLLKKILLDNISILNHDFERLKYF